ncbi:MAG: S-layer glycoprotein N-glycosyltransferase AglJ [Candidatus Methanofastidiosia archaeon]
MKISVIIPTLNEEKTIEEVIEGFKKQKVSEIIVVDGNSQDETRRIARRLGAEVFIQPEKGKGEAVLYGFEKASGDVLVLIDGDATYLPEELPKLLKPLDEGCEHVIGKRKFSSGAITKFNMLGNKILNKMFGMFYGEFFSDILTGYRVITKDAFERLDLASMGFGIEPELLIESIRKRVKICEVEISYLRRPKGSKTKLHPLRDGLKIGLTIYRLTRLHNPLFFFGIIGAVFLIIGFFFGTIILQEYFRTGFVTRIPLTILSILLLLGGLNFLLIAVIADLIIMLHKDTMNLIQRLEFSNKK